MKKVFGNSTFDQEGKMVLTTYTNAYQDMLMDISVYKVREHQTLTFHSLDEEIAVLLLEGSIEYTCDNQILQANRRSVFLDGPYAAHVCKDRKISVSAIQDAMILVQKTKNDKTFPSKIYQPHDVVWKYSCKGSFGNVANRRVNTIFDIDMQPNSNMVLGEVLNDPGNWSGYLPHQHAQPECYYFLFDHPEGFGASFVGDEVFKSTNHSFSAIPGGKTHPQSVAPGFQMYTCWMIRHLEGNPWTQQDRCEDEAYAWLRNTTFDMDLHAFVKKEN